MIPDKKEYIDEIHRQGLKFVELAKEYFVSSLLKKQLKILIELEPNDIKYSSSLKNKFVSNFNKKSNPLHTQKISFMLFNFMINQNLYNISSDTFKCTINNGIKSENNLIDPLVFEKVVKEEKIEKSENKKKNESENKQLYDFFYLLLDGCVKIWEVCK